MKQLRKRIFGAGVIAGILMGTAVYLYCNGLSGKHENTKAGEGQIKVACVGDSITYGYGISNWKENNYPTVLQNLLGEGYHVANFGSSGSCVNPNGSKPYVKEKVYQESLEYDADILVFMLGTNDSKPGNWAGIEQFMEDYRELIGTYMEKEQPPKLYIGICAEAYFIKENKNGIAEFDIQPKIVDEIAQSLKQMSISEEFSYSIIDIHSLTEVHSEWFKKDGIHPNKEGARAIAEAVAKAL